MEHRLRIPSLTCALAPLLWLFSQRQATYKSRTFTIKSWSALTAAALLLRTVGHWLVSYHSCPPLLLLYIHPPFFAIIIIIIFICHILISIRIVVPVIFIVLRSSVDECKSKKNKTDAKIHSPFVVRAIWWLTGRSAVCGLSLVFFLLYTRRVVFFYCWN